MEQELLRKVQLAQLDIAKEIKRVCTENQIDYFLDSGSLLGAVRHRGFIPWDDDMDFGMTYEAYQKFIKIAPQKLGDLFFLQTWESDDYYPFPYCKVLKIGTEYVEDVFENSKKRNELFVDIFPYYPFPNSPQIQRKQKNTILFCRYILNTQAGMMPWVHWDNFVRRVLAWFKYLPFIFLSKFADRKRVIKKYKQALRLSLNQESYSLFSTGSTRYDTWVIPDACVKSYTNLKFEDTYFKAPADYRLYLESTYGDYMKLPPENERNKGHQVVRIKL